MPRGIRGHKLNSIELFAGVGGLAMGVSKAGFEQLFSVEQNRRCCETINLNIKNGLLDLNDWDVLNSRIEDSDFSFFSDSVDLISGGPPCQPFSLGGKHLGNLDKRDGFPHAIEAIRVVRPKAFLFENVRGLTNKKFSNYFEYVKLCLTYPDHLKKENETWEEHLSRLEDFHSCGKIIGLNYKVLSKVINAADYGVPQKRERVFIVGFRSDLGVKWHFPMPTHSQKALIWSQKTGEYWDNYGISNKKRKLSHGVLAQFNKINEEPSSRPWKTLRDAISGLPKPTSQTMDEFRFHNHELRLGAKPYPGHTGSLLDEPSKTLKAGSHGVPGGENMIRNYDDSVRYFTIRESARLQTFSDDFKFDCAWGQAMWQLGNAVPVELSMLLSNSIKDSLLNSSKG